MYRQQKEWGGISGRHRDGHGKENGGVARIIRKDQWQNSAVSESATVERGLQPSKLRGKGENDSVFHNLIGQGGECLSTSFFLLRGFR